MEFEKLAKEFWENGFLLIENYFDSQLMDTYKDLILDHYGMHPEFLHNEEFLSRSGAEVTPWFPSVRGLLHLTVLRNTSNTNHYFLNSIFLWAISVLILTI